MCSGFLPVLLPQVEQIWELGKYWSIFSKVLPFQLALYSNRLMSLDQLALAMLLASLWFLTKFLTFKVSTAIKSYWLIWLLILCKYSSLLFLIVARICATFLTCFFLLLEPLSFLNNLLCILVSLVCRFWKNFYRGKTRHYWRWLETLSPYLNLQLFW